jgi:hypothetical protein
LPTSTRPANSSCAQHAEKQAEHPHRLHLADQFHPVAQAGEFLVVLRLSALDLRVQLADHRRHREETVGVGKQQQRDRRKQQRRRGQRQFHGRSDCLV